MKIQQIRSATVKIEYAGKTFLVDPWLTHQHMSGCFAVMPLLVAMNRKGDPRKKPVIDHSATWKVADPRHTWIMVPRCPLPMPVKEINRGVDYYLCTHVHMDHIGLSPSGKGCERMDKRIPIFAQSQQDADYLAYSGMKDVRVLWKVARLGDMELIKVKAVHGTEKPCGDASGYIFRSPGEKTLYLCGDTVWCPEVKETIEQYRPQVIITNNCAAVLQDYGRLIMDDADLYQVYKAAPDAAIIASHMDNVPHATLTRKTLREKLAARGISQAILIPEDGESYEF